MKIKSSQRCNSRTHYHTVCVDHTVTGLYPQNTGLQWYYMVARVIIFTQDILYIGKLYMWSLAGVGRCKHSRHESHLVDWPVTFYIHLVSIVTIDWTQFKEHTPTAKLSLYGFASICSHTFVISILLRDWTWSHLAPLLCSRLDVKLCGQVVIIHYNLVIIRMPSWNNGGFSDLAVETQREIFYHSVGCIHYMPLQCEYVQCDS